MKKPLFLLTLLALLVCAASQSFAFKISGERWTRNRSVMMHLSLGEFQPLQDGFTSFNDSAADALATWNQHLVHMKFRWLLGSTLPQSKTDADNSVFFSSNVYGDSFGRNVLAITLISTRGSVTIESDVIFNSARMYDSYRGPQQGELFDFHRIALHEFGHVIGLDHPDQGTNPQRVSALMNSRIGDLDALTRDDIAGAHALYDAGPEYLSSVPAPNLVNLSTRAFIGTGEEVMIGGFIVQGSQPATVILRAIGNSLSARGVSGTNEDPTIELRSGSGQLQFNDDWVDYRNAETVASYGLDPTGSREAAIIATLQPGNYTVVIRGFEDVTGVGLVELYDLHTTNGRAGNISTRARVGTGNDVMVAGFIIGSGTSKRVVVRGLGASLRDSGVANSLNDPVIDLRDRDGNRIRLNDDWESDPESNEVRNSGLAPRHGNESAMHVTLNSGSYTAIMSGFDNQTGIGLVEVYDLSPAP
ncbi:MAG TPA: matrixin family metalloprotease [Chthoniobacterales bacterium]|nr:matrixin family metalloprotease [Chthoniobacterales bacterium]